MSPTDLRIYQGDDYAATVTVSNPDGTPADLSGYTAQAQIRRDYADAEPTVAVEITCVVNTPLINLAIPAAQTAQLCGKYVWDLQIIGPGGAITTILAGAAIVASEVTREVTSPLSTNRRMAIGVK